MQPLSGPRGDTGDSRLTTASGQHSLPKSAVAHSEALTTAQRTALERIIVRILSLSSLKAPELWAGIRHHLGVAGDAELLAAHFPAAEHWLNSRLEQEQNNHLSRRQLQQLTDLLPQGNNRQAVSDFIRQHFGQTVLSALTPAQLQQVLTMLQQGQITIPQPVQHNLTERNLLPAEHQNLNQQIIKLSVANGESPLTLWETLYRLIGLKQGDPIPVRHYPMLVQYLQARQALIGQPNITLPLLFQCLKQPLTADEVQQATRFCQQHYQLPDSHIVSLAQADDLLNNLFRGRAGLPWLAENSRIISGTSHSAKSTSPQTETQLGLITPERLWAIVVVVALLLVVFWLF